jgi:hypothetical protein
MKIPKSLTTVTHFSKIITLIFFILFPFLSFYLGFKYHQLTNPKPIVKNIDKSQTANLLNENTKVYKYYMDDKYGFTLNYPENSTIEESTQSANIEEFNLTIKPPAKYYTDQSEIIISIVKQDSTKPHNDYSPETVIRKDIDNNQVFIEGVLPILIDKLPTYKYYYLECPGSEDFFCNDYIKRSVIYINPLGYFFTIRTMHHTDSYGSPFNKKVLDSIIDSIHFLQSSQ